MLGMRGFWLVACVAAALAAAAPRVHAATVTVDAGVQYQEIAGWGTCLFPNTHADEQSVYLDPRWRAAYRDLGCNILRLNCEPVVLVAEGGDLTGPEVPLGEDIAENIARFNFEQARFRHSDDLARWLAENALEPERVKIVLSNWSVPHWAKAPTGGFLESGFGTGGTPLIMYCPMCDTAGGTWDDGTYREDRFAYCARYLAAFCKGFEQHAGVPVYALSIQNEAAFEQGFNSCTLFHRAKAERGTRESHETTMDFAVYARALKAVRDEWARHPELAHVRIMGPHHASVGDSPDNPWALTWQMQAIQAVKDDADPALADFLAIYTHNYSAESAGRARMFRAYWEGKGAVSGAAWADWVFAPGIAGDGKQTWNSECDGEPSWPGCLDMACDMQTQLVWGHESAMIHWQFCNNNRGPTGSELLGTGNLDDPLTSHKYCLFKHFSRFIRPGARRVQAQFEGGAPSWGVTDPMDAENALNVSAYVHTGDGTVTVVLVNMQAQAHDVTVRLQGAPEADALQVYRTSETEHFVRLPDTPVEEGAASVTVPARSVVTLVGHAGSRG